MGDFSESKASREEAELRAPFVRNDRFGEFGMGNLPTCLKAVLALESIFILPFRAVGSFLCLFLYWLVCRLSSPLPPQHRAAIVVPMGKLACRSCLFCIGFFKVEWVLDPAAGQGPRAGGIVSNHCSWADILLHMSHSFPAFVARDSTANLPFIGIISQMMSCLYVNRNRTGRNQAGVADLVKQRMEDEAAGRTGVEKRPLLLFPEGTTSNGEYMLPFKTGAFLAGVPVQPVVIKYHRGTIWPTWETIPPLRHLFLLLCHPRHSVTFLELPVYVPNEAEKADPKLYADNVRKMMMEHSGTKDTRATFEDKMRYLTMLKKQYGKALPKKSE
ncbi:PGA3 [Auxenochlorella protothecoides x Auxenochlorella symbiontica]